MRRHAFDAEEAMLNMDRISPFQWRHLRKLYACLLCLSASSALGSYTAEYIENHIALCGAVLSFYCFYRIAPWHEKKRVCLLSWGAYFGWAFTNPWLTWFLGIDPCFTVTLLSATYVGFGCYWVASKWTNRFELVYFRALLLCILLVPICLHACSSAFAGDSAHWEFELYPLILWYMVYVAAYSQIVMLKTRRGENDYVQHAIRLFTDFPCFPMHCMKVMKAMRRR